MRIVIFIPFFLPVENGLVNYVVGLYSEIKKQKPDIDLTVITFDSRNTDELVTQNGIFKIYNLPCHILLGGTYVIPSFRGIRDFWKIVKEEKFDSVNTHTRFFISSLFGLILAKKHSIPLLHTEHGSSFVKDGIWFTRAIARFFDETIGRIIISSATILFGDSDACIKFANKLGGKNGIVIYNGIDSSYWKTEERESNFLPKITFCGRMVKGKGVQDLLKALAKLKELNWELHLLGIGNYLAELQKLALELEINNRIIWHGNRDRDFLKNLLKTTDIFVNPSYTEGLPTSVLEAGAMQCAIIATDVGGTKSIIDNGVNGILIPEPSKKPIESLYQALQTLLANPQLQGEYGRMVEKKVKENFSWNMISQKFLAHISE